MDAEARSQVRQALLRRREAIAESWYRAVTRTGYAPLGRKHVRGQLSALTEEAIALLLTEPFEYHRAEAIGASLAEMHHLGPEALGRTQQVLAQQLMEGLPAGQAVALQPHLAALLGGVASGFVDRAHATILFEQERVRSALSNALQESQQALQKAYEEVEQQVQERTAELRATNEQLKREIAERKRMQEKLQNAARQWHATFDAINDTVFLLDLENRIQRCNEATAEMLDKTFGEIIGHHCWELVHGTSEPIEGCPVVRLWGTRGRETLVWQRDDRWFHVSADPVLDEDGDLIGAVHIMSDITARRQAEEALRESEERFRTVSEIIFDYAYSERIEPDGTSVQEWITESQARVTGYTLEELEAEDVRWGLIYPEDMPIVLQRMEKLHSGQPDVSEFRIVTKSGEIRWVRDYGRPVWNEAQGRVVRVIGAAQDITERKRMEQALQKAHDELEQRVEERTAELALANEQLRQEIEERKRTEQKLRVRESTVRALLNAPIEIAILIDTEGTILALNETAAKSLGKSADELVGSCIYDLFPPALAKSRKAQTDKVLRMGTPVRFQDERRGRCFDSSLYPILDAQGKVIQVAIFARDITHRKQAEERIRAYQGRLRSLASELSLTEERERRQIANALHDRVGQTLAICKMKLGALQKTASSTQLGRSLGETCKLIESVIQDTRTLTFELSPPVLYELGLEAAIEELAEQAQERDGIPYQFEDDGQPKPLDEDVRVLLFQATRELLINVAKHARAQNVEVAMLRESEDIQIIVEDDGVGFDTPSLESHWSKAGGFGLFSIRERLDHVGGHLRVKTEPGHGTRITVVAPLKREQGGSGQG